MRPDAPTAAGVPPSPIEDSAATFPSRGRWVVVALLGVGLLSTAAIWAYWKVRLTPFVPLRKALGAAFPRSSPRAEAVKSRSGPRLLIVSLDVPRPPHPDDPQTRADLQKIVEISRVEHDLRAYDVLEIYLTKRIPERRPKRLKAGFQMAAVLEAPAGKLPPGVVIDPDSPAPPR